MAFPPHPSVIESPRKRRSTAPSFVRFNSWDALVRPGRVLDVVRTQLENPLQHPRLLAVLLALTAFLLVGYAVVYALATLMAPLERS